MEDTILKIAGDIALSSNPGGSMRKWREIFSVSQTELAKHMGVSLSTVCDNESNRRKSPGVSVVKRFVTSLVELDNARGGKVLRKLVGGSTQGDVYSVFEFSYPVAVSELCEKIGANILTNEKLAEKKMIHGVTIVDSVRAITELPGEEFQKIYGSSSERALVFSKVSMGRSPFVAIRVTNFKPSLVVLHGLRDDQVDELALKISKLEKIPLAVTSRRLEDVEQVLQDYE